MVRNFLGEFSKTCSASVKTSCRYECTHSHDTGTWGGHMRCIGKIFLGVDWHRNLVCYWLNSWLVLLGLLFSFFFFLFLYNFYRSVGRCITDSKEGFLFSLKQVSISLGPFCFSISSFFSKFYSLLWLWNSHFILYSLRNISASRLKKTVSSKITLFILICNSPRNFPQETNRRTWRWGHKLTSCCSLKVYCGQDVCCSFCPRRPGWKPAQVKDNRRQSGFSIEE